MHGKMLPISLIVMMLLIACAKNDRGMVVLGEVESLTIFDSEGYGGIGKQPRFKQEGEMAGSTWQGIMKRARLTDGNITHLPPRYDIEVHYSNNQTHLLHFVYEEEKNAAYFVYVGYENRAYILAEQDRAEVLKWLDEKGKEPL